MSANEPRGESNFYSTENEKAVELHVETMGPLGLFFSQLSFLRSSSFFFSTMEEKKRERRTTQQFKCKEQTSCNVVVE